MSGKRTASQALGDLERKAASVALNAATGGLWQDVKDGIDIAEDVGTVVRGVVSSSGEPARRLKRQKLITEYHKEVKNYFKKRKLTKRKFYPKTRSWVPYSKYYRRGKFYYRRRFPYRRRYRRR